MAHSRQWTDEILHVTTIKISCRGTRRKAEEMSGQTSEGPACQAEQSGYYPLRNGEPLKVCDLETKMKARVLEIYLTGR